MPDDTIGDLKKMVAAQTGKCKTTTLIGSLFNTAAI
jgi:hypothetical protein